jgi:hypothetical protein
VNLPVGLAGLVLVYLHLPDYREANTMPLDIAGPILFGSGVELLSYVLEIFGEHSLSLAEILGLLSISLALIAGYAMHAMRTACPLLQMNLFRIRTFSAAVNGSFFTRLGIGGVPSLLPLLYQVGLGLTPVQSGLLVMPQAIAAMSTKFLMPKILDRVGFGGVVISNTIVLGLFLMLFATVGVGTPLWVNVVQTFFYGAFTSLQYTSMNSLVYADIPDDRASAATPLPARCSRCRLASASRRRGSQRHFSYPPTLAQTPGR